MRPEVLLNTDEKAFAFFFFLFVLLGLCVTASDRRDTMKRQHIQKQGGGTKKKQR